MSCFHFTPRAQADLESHLDYIARDRPGAVVIGSESPGKRCRTLAENPGWGRQREDLRPGLRSPPFGRYLNSYRMTARNVEIVRVLHAARDIAADFP